MKLFGFRTQKIETIQKNWYSLSAPLQTILSNPIDRHGFAVVHNTNIIRCDVLVDGARRAYLAYDSNNLGNQIRLYHSDKVDGTWVPYSGNPILSKMNSFRTPSVALVDGIFHMFLNNIDDHNIERWTSVDGINFSYVERILRTSYDAWTNPFVWLNPNDKLWYLFWSRGTNAGKKWSILARKNSSISKLAGKSDVTVLASSDLKHLAYPTIMFSDGYYWLLTETGNTVSKSIVNWNINAFVSSNVTKGYKQCSNSPILTNDDACPQIFVDETGNCYLFTNHNSSNNVWNQETRTVYL